MKHNRYKILVLSFVTTLFFTACKKDKEIPAITDEGKTTVKIISGGAPDHNAGQTLTGIDFVNKPQTITLAEIRRDPNSSAALNTSMKVSLQLDTVLLKRINDTIINHGGSPLQKMPASWYALSTGGELGNTMVLDFAAGEISKTISVSIPNAQMFDPGSTYAFPFRLVSVSTAGSKISINSALIAKVAAKNQYDGVYELTFSNYHPTANPGYTGDKVTVQLITTALDKVKIYWPDEGDYVNPAVLSGSLSYFTGQEPEYTIDAATNKVTVQNAYTGATTFYSMNPGFNSFYDPVAKKIYAKWGYNYVGGTFALGTSREWMQEFKYTGPR
ncbi:BT_3987 domain-containing protein [Ferruginibacter profundus]